MESLSCLMKRPVQFQQAAKHERFPPHGRSCVFRLRLTTLDIRDLTAAPLLDRKAALRELLTAGTVSQIWYSDHVVGSGQEFYRAAREHRLECVVCFEAGQ